MGMVMYQASCSLDCCHHHSLKDTPGSCTIEIKVQPTDGARGLGCLLPARARLFIISPRGRSFSGGDVTPGAGEGGGVTTPYPIPFL